MTLQRLWPSYNTNEIKIAFPAKYLKEIVEVLNRLAFSYFKLRKLEPTERTYRRIFYSSLATPITPDNILLGALKNLIYFYQPHSMIKKTVTTYRDFYPEIGKRRGKTDTLTISTLYSLGDISTQINDTKNAEFAYSQIHIKFFSNICHREAIRAVLALCTIHERERNYPSAQKVYTSHWQILIKHVKDYEFKSDFAEELCNKFILLLKATKTEYTVIRQIAIDYRKACVRFYGTTNESTLKATLGLAKIKEERDEYIEESTALYEEAFWFSLMLLTKILTRLGKPDGLC
ncbi:unnamed protein product [Sphagnum balticum]